MPETMEFEGYSVEIRRKAFQRRLSVTVHPSGVVRVSANKTLGQRAIKKFLMENRVWLEKSLSSASELREQYPPKRFKNGETFPFLGENLSLQIQQGEGPRVEVRNGQILFFIPHAEDQLSLSQQKKYLQAFKKSYRQVAEKIMSERISFWSQKMQLFPSGVQFRGQKSIWGSCSPENKISLNFKLIVAPIEVVDYVLIHELAHIRHKDHSKNFWKLVEAFTPHRHFSRDWLRANSFAADFLNKKSELFDSSRV